MSLDFFVAVPLPLTWTKYLNMSAAASHTSEADRGKANLLAVSCVLVGLSLMVVLLRFYARRQQKVQIKADDYLVLPALVSCPSPFTQQWLEYSVEQLTDQ